MTGVAKEVRKWTRWEDVPLNLSSAQVQEVLGIGYDHLNKLADAGILRRFKVGRIWRYPRAGLMEYCGGQGCDPF